MVNVNLPYNVMLYFGLVDEYINRDIRQILIFTETRYRREGVRFIMELGKALNLSHNTMATGGVYYHRFYMFHSFQEFPR